MALLVVVVRTLFRFLFGGYTLEALLLGFKDGLWLGLWVIGFGLLNLVFDMSKLATKIPGRTGTAVSIAINLVPEQARSIERIRYAASLRARRKGARLILSVISPAIRSAVDGSLDLAASMETRGLGAGKQTDNYDTEDLVFSYAKCPAKYRGMKLPSGSITLISGPTGSGKSTLLKMYCGLAPHFTGGSVNMHTPKPNQLARHVAYVNQSPSRSFVASTVFEELSFGPKQLKLAESSVFEIADHFGLRDKLALDPHSLSAGWQQRVAIAAAVTGGAKTLLLDEPFSMLDGAGRTELLELIKNLKAIGYAIAIAEHRTSLLRSLADREISLGVTKHRLGKQARTQSSTGVHEFEPVTLAFGNNVVFENFKVSLARGVVTVLTGPNGSGKSSLLRELAKQNSALVPQPAADLLFMNSVAEELEQADRDNKLQPGASLATLKKLIPEILTANNPVDLSEGQKLALAIAIQLGQNRPVLLLDEPTVGFDEAAKNSLAEILFEITKTGKTVLLATHDHEFAERISNNYINLGVVDVRQ